MKPKPIIRIIFAFLVAAGSMFLLYGARQNSTLTQQKETNICESELGQPFQHSSTEFIFFEAVTKFLVISLIK
jgi:hypothetical protein